MRDNLFVTNPKPNEFEVNFNETHFLVREQGGRELGPGRVTMPPQSQVHDMGCWRSPEQRVSVVVGSV